MEWEWEPASVVWQRAGGLSGRPPHEIIVVVLVLVLVLVFVFALVLLLEDVHVLIESAVVVALGNACLGAPCKVLLLMIWYCLCLHYVFR